MTAEFGEIMYAYCNKNLQKRRNAWYTLKSYHNDSIWRRGAINLLLVAQERAVIGEGALISF